MNAVALAILKCHPEGWEVPPLRDALRCVETGFIIVSTAIPPLARLTMACTVESPRPVPFPGSLVVKNGSREVGLKSYQIPEREGTLGVAATLRGRCLHHPPANRQPTLADVAGLATAL